MICEVKINAKDNSGWTLKFKLNLNRHISSCQRIENADMDLDNI